MKVKITMDSTADASKQFLESYGISYLPLIVNLGEKYFSEKIVIVSQ